MAESAPGNSSWLEHEKLAIYFPQSGVRHEVTAEENAGNGSEHCHWQIRLTDNCFSAGHTF